MAITQPLSKLTLLEEQAVSITDYLGHGPWSCQTFYVDVSMKLKDDGISSRLLQQIEKKGQICLKVTSTGITTGTETWKWSYGSSLCSGCQQSPSKACKLEKQKLQTTDRCCSASIRQEKRTGHPYSYSCCEPFWAALGKVSESCCSKPEKKNFLRW